MGKITVTEADVRAALESRGKPGSRTDIMLSILSLKRLPQPMPEAGGSDAAAIKAAFSQPSLTQALEGLKGAGEIVEKFGEQLDAEGIGFYGMTPRGRYWALVPKEEPVATPVTDKPLAPEREAHIKKTANEQATVPATFVGELLWEIERLRAGQERLQELMRAEQHWDDRWLSSEALLTQDQIRKCFGWHPEPPEGARPFCACGHTPGATTTAPATPARAPAPRAPPTPQGGMMSVRRQADDVIMSGIGVVRRSQTDLLGHTVAQRITARVGLIWPDAVALLIRPNPGSFRNEIQVVLGEGGAVLEENRFYPRGMLLQGRGRSEHALDLTEDVHLLTALYPYGREGLIERHHPREEDGSPGNAEYTITLPKEDW
jgi:hypothetical protein